MRRDTSLLEMLINRPFLSFFEPHCESEKCKIFITVEPLYYGHQGDRNKYFREEGFIRILVSQGPSKTVRIIEVSVL